MFGSLARKIFGSANDRFLKLLYDTVAEINAHEEQLQKLGDTELAARDVAPALERIDDSPCRAIVQTRDDRYRRDVDLRRLVAGRRDRFTLLSSIESLMPKATTTA